MCMFTNKLLSVSLLAATLFVVLIPNVAAGPVAGRTSARAKHPTARTAQAQHRLNAQLEIADRSGPRGSPDFFRFRSLLAQGADPNAPTPIGSDHPTLKNSTTWLIWYSALGDTRTVQALLYHGAEVNAHGYGIGHLGPSDRDNSTALIVACGRSDNGDVIQLLLEHGAKVNVHDISGRTPLSVAEWISDKDECALLRQYGASEKYRRRWQRKLSENDNNAR
jgi:hypothetical protein